VELKQGLSATEVGVKQVHTTEEIMKRIVHVVVAGAFIAGATGSAAFASPTEPYWPVEQDGGHVSSDVVAPGEAVTVSFGGFQPYSTVTISLKQVTPATSLGSATTLGTSVGPIALASSSSKTVTEQADGEGFVRLDVTLPESGTYTVRAEGVDPSGAQRSVSTRVTATGNDAGSSVSPAQPGDGTGSAVVLALGAGFVVTAAGTALVVRRRTREPQET
jgi:hypothetical protein